MEKMPGTGNAMIEMYKGEEDIEYPCDHHDIKHLGLEATEMEPKYSSESSVQSVVVLDTENTMSTTTQQSGMSDYATLWGVLIAKHYLTIW